MGSLRRAAGILGLCLATASCTSGTCSMTWLQECVDDPGRRLRGINWLEAEKIDIRIRDGELQPMTVRLSQGKPYVFRVQNRDDWSQRFQSADFFSAIVVGKSSVDGAESKEPCISSVMVEPEKTVEIEFVAVRDGRYPVEVRSILKPPMMPGVGHGVVGIRQPFSPFALSLPTPDSRRLRL
ncbi:MAG: hypothetical protein EXQ90_02230 [Rhodospirillales bacterium]|nr:hypothetical protein [Rhodospirillales bacterium]